VEQPGLEPRNEAAPRSDAVSRLRVPPASDMKQRGYALRVSFLGYASCAVDSRVAGAGWLAAGQSRPDSKSSGTAPADDARRRWPGPRSNGTEPEQAPTRRRACFGCSQRGKHGALVGIASLYPRGGRRLQGFKLQG
jgi:hypothetical protein